MKWLSAALAVVLLALCPPAVAAPVKASDYDAFWLWAGVAPQPVLARARSLYILNGQVGFSPRDPKALGHLIAQGGATPRIRKGEVWMVYRAHTLNWRPEVHTQILGQVKRWRAAGVPVVGIQIDFDARTRHLDQYQAFLTGLHKRLPPGCRLGITGLLDWSSGGDSAGLNALGSAVDEIVLQTYQGRRTIPGYAAYLDNLKWLKVPFKIGLAQGGDWSAPPGLSSNPYFKGYVVFLQNPR